MTGEPFVDAAMREMYVTGTMHNRARMIAASYLTKHLLTALAVGQDWFADCLTDWDPAANAMGWQWVAGSGPDAAPYFRVFNPAGRPRSSMPTGRYRRRFVAELSPAPGPEALGFFEAVPRSWGLAPGQAYPRRSSIWPGAGRGPLRPMVHERLERRIDFGETARKRQRPRGGGPMDVLTTVKGQAGLPRWFATVFETAGRLGEGRLDFVLPDGRRFRAEGKGPGIAAEITVQNPDLFARLVREGDLGFCDAYLDGWWTTPDLQAFLDLIQLPANTMVGDGFPGLGLVRAYERLRFWMQSNSKRQAKKNIAYHYDLGNEFYRLWLDETMTYSSAIFQNPQESLEAAQRRKYASMIDQMGARPGEHVLEIGCGWGGFAEYAAKERGCGSRG
jgi:hypothetical protein